MTVAAAISVTCPAGKHLHPDRQGLEAHIVTRLLNGVLICNGTGLEVMVAGASEDTGLAKER